MFTIYFIKIDMFNGRMRRCKLYLCVSSTDRGLPSLAQRLKAGNCVSLAPSKEKKIQLQTTPALSDLHVESANKLVTNPRWFSDLYHAHIKT